MLRTTLFADSAARAWWGLVRGAQSQRAHCFELVERQVSSRAGNVLYPPNPQVHCTGLDSTQPTLTGIRCYAASGFPPHEVMAMPALSPTMEQGNLVEWKVNEGAEVAAGDIIADIETDKATLGFETQEDGFIAKLLVPNGTRDIPVGTPVAVMVDARENVGAFAEFTADSAGPHGAGSGSGSKAAEHSAGQDGIGVTTGGAEAVQRNDRLGPAARMALANAGLSVGDVTPSGPNGIVTKADVFAAVDDASAKAQPPQEGASGQSTPHEVPDEEAKSAEGAPVQAGMQAAADHREPQAAKKQGAQVAAGGGTQGRFRHGSGPRYSDVPLSNMRRVIARRLLESKVSIPAIYVAGNARLEGVTAVRGALKAAGMSASVNDFVVKAAAAALRKVPSVCAGWDAKAERVMAFDKVDISVAVATEGGLITPIVTDADKKGITEVNADIRDLAGRARANKLAPHEFSGGSFTISNLGMFGTKEFCAIINPPQACIMAVGGTQERTVMAEDGRLRTETFMTVTLSADSRVIGEDSASEFLRSFAFHMENPALLMGSSL